MEHDAGPSEAEPQSRRRSVDDPSDDRSLRPGGPRAGTVGKADRPSPSADPFAWPAASSASDAASGDPPTSGTRGRRQADTDERPVACDPRVRGGPRMGGESDSRPSLASEPESSQRGEQRADRQQQQQHGGGRGALRDGRRRLADLRLEDSSEEGALKGPGGLVGSKAVDSVVKVASPDPGSSARPPPPVAATRDEDKPPRQAATRHRGPGRAGAGGGSSSDDEDGDGAVPDWLARRMAAKAGAGASASVDMAGPEPGAASGRIGGGSVLGGTRGKTSVSREGGRAGPPARDSAAVHRPATTVPAAEAESAASIPRRPSRPLQRSPQRQQQSAAQGLSSSRDEAADMQPWEAKGTTGRGSAEDQTSQFRAKTSVPLVPSHDRLRRPPAGIGDASSGGRDRPGPAPSTTAGATPPRVAGTLGDGDGDDDDEVLSRPMPSRRPPPQSQLLRPPQPSAASALGTRAGPSAAAPPAGRRRSPTPRRPPPPAAAESLSPTAAPTMQPAPSAELSDDDEFTGRVARRNTTARRPA